MCRFLISRNNSYWLGLYTKNRDNIFRCITEGNYQHIININPKITTTKDNLIKIAWNSGLKSSSGINHMIENVELAYDLYHDEFSKFKRTKIAEEIWQYLKKNGRIFDL